MLTAFLTRRRRKRSHNVTTRSTFLPFIPVFRKGILFEYKDSNNKKLKL